MLYINKVKHTTFISWQDLEDKIVFVYCVQDCGATTAKQC